MREKPDKPLTPPELFQHGIEMTREIRKSIVEARAYYLGRSSRVPAHLLSEVFDPARGPSISYFVQTLRTINGTRFIGRHCRTATFREFQRSSEAALEELRLLANQMAMCIGVPDKTDRRHSVGQALKISVYFFRVASGRFFRQLPWSGSLLRLLLRNRNNVGMGIYVADRLLNDISKAFEVRERQLRGESAAPAHEFFTSQFERIERKIESEHERTRQRIEETNGLVQKVLPAITKALPFLRDRHRYKVPVKVAAAAMGISTRELYRILNHKVEAPDGFPGLDDEVRFYHWVANYRKRIGLQSAIQEKAETIRKWGRQVSVR